MFALDLFNNDHERRIAEGAVDQLEQRRIDDLAMKMDDLVARAKTAATPAVKQALMKEFQKCKSERDSYYKIKDECMGYGSLGETDQVPVGRMQPGTSEYATARNRSVKYAGLPDVADKATKMDRLNQPGKVGTDIVTPQQRVNPNPNKGVVGHAVDWLRGRGGPGKEGPTLEEFAVAAEQEGDSRVYAARLVFQQIIKSVQDNVDFATITWPDNSTQKLTRNQMWHLVQKARGMSRQARNQWALKILPTPNDLMYYLGNLKKVEPRPQAKPPVDPNQPSLDLPKPLEELAQKKNSEKINSPTAQDAEVQNKLTRLRAEYPGANTDVEALTKNNIVQQGNTQKEIEQLRSIDSDQDAQLNKIAALNQQQEKEVTALTQELSRLDGKLNQVLAKASRPITSPTPAKSATTAPAEPTTVFTPGEMPTTSDAKTNQEIAKLQSQISQLETMMTLKAPSDPKAQERLQQQIDNLEARLETLTNRPTGTPQLPNTQPTTLPAVEIPSVRAGANDINVGDRRQDAAPDGDFNILDLGDFDDLDEPTTTKKKKHRDKTVDKPGGTTPFTGGTRNNQWGPKNMQGDRYTVQDVVPVEKELTEEQRLRPGDPIVVTAPNEFEGKTGEIYEFSPSGSFVIVDLYNHGKHSMHLSDVKYNDYADQEEADDWYDDADEFGKPGSEFFSEAGNPKLDALIKNIQARVPKVAVQRPEIMQRVAQMVAQADPTVPDAMATAQQLVQQYGQGAPAAAQTNTNDIKAQARSGDVMAQLPKTSAGAPTYAQQHSTFEGFQDFNKVEPYAVCLAGKPVKKFDYYEQARQFHDNWKKKLYNTGKPEDKEKADKITLMPLNLDEDVMGELGYDRSLNTSIERGGIILKASIVNAGELIITAETKDGRKLGRGVFKDMGDTIEAIKIDVDDRYRRQGIATLIYDYAEELGNDIEPSDEQTDDGQAFWSQRRPNSDQLDEYIVRSGDDISSVLSLNLFADLLGQGNLSDYDEEFANSPKWQTVVSKWAPKAEYLQREIAKYQNTGRKLRDAEADALDATAYDGSDAYENADIAAQYLPKVYNKQATAIVRLLKDGYTNPPAGLHEDSAMTQQQWMQSMKQQHPGVTFAQNKTTMQIFALAPGKGKVGTFDPHQQVTELEVADLVRPGAQTDTPPRRAYSIALQGKPGRDWNADKGWAALNRVFPQDYPAGSNAAEYKVVEVSRRGSAIVKTGISSEDIAETYVSKLSGFVPEQFWRIVGGELEETKADPTGSWVVYGGGKVVKFKTHSGAKAYAEKTGGKVASSEFYADRIQKQGVAEATPRHFGPKGAGTELARQIRANGDTNWVNDLSKDQLNALAGPRYPKRPKIQVKKNKGVAEVAPPGAKAERMVKHIKKSLSKDGHLSDKDKAIAYATTWKAHNAGKVEENQDPAMFQVCADGKCSSPVYADMAKKLKAAAEHTGKYKTVEIRPVIAENQTDYQKRRQRERDVDAGKPVKPLPKNPQTDYARKRAKDRKDMELGEQNLNEDNASEAAVQAILRRIMVAHKDLLVKFGPDKVMQAVDEVAYNVGDVAEIGSSDISIWVNQVKQILGAK